MPYMVQHSTDFSQSIKEKGKNVHQTRTVARQMQKIN